MKKFLFGCCLMLVGAICGTGILVAHCCACVEPRAWSTVWNVLSGVDGAVILMFYGIAILGMAVAVRDLREQR